MAAAWRSALQESGHDRYLGEAGRETQERWPILTAWRWLVIMADRESQLTAADDGHSAPTVLAEGQMDLGYRSAVPKALGRALVALSAQTVGSPRETQGDLD